jgi:phage terminase small subunit
MRESLKSIKPRHEEFILRYVAHPYNATKAYVDSGFSAATANGSVGRLLADPLIKARIKELLEEKHKALHMDIDEILARAAMLARADIRALYDPNGVLRSPADLEEAHSFAISSLTVEETFVGHGKNKVKVGEIKRIKLRDPFPAIRLLAEHKKLVRDSDDGVNALASALADRLKAARERRRTKESSK